MSNKNQNRREAILDAVITLLAEQGLAGVTHRATDAAAGLPQGSTTYYFSKKTDLLHAAAQHLEQELQKGCSALQIQFAEIAARQGVETAIDQVANALVASSDLDKHMTLARMELTLAAARHHDFADIGDRLSAAARQPIAFFIGLISGGASQNEIESCAGLIDGISLMYAAGQAPQPTTEQLKSVFRTYISKEE